MLLKKNQPIRIVLPQTPSAVELFAAEELEKYLFRIFNATVGEADALFVLGADAKNPAFTGEEGFLIQSEGNVIRIIGSDGNGVLYGVYEFLERYLGCCFGAYSGADKNAGEIVPTYEEKELSDIAYCKPKSDRPYRTAIVQYGNKAGNPDHKLNIPFFDWLAKNRYNRILTWSSVYEFYHEQGLDQEAAKRGIRFTVGHHESSHLFLPENGNKYFPEPYYKTHPEFFKLQEDGTRFYNDSETGQLVYCCRNEEMIETFAKNVLAWAEQNPAIDTVALWPNDGIQPACTCPLCKPYSKVENYTYFVNSVAERVRKERPDFHFDMLIYVDLWECPEGLKLNEGIFVDESTWSPKGLRHVGKADGSCINGTFLEENLLRWKATGAEVVYYDYYMGGYGVRQLLIPMADEVQSIWKNFAKKGVSGAGTQIECFNHWNHLLNFYTFGRTAYDASLTVEDNIRALVKLFGEGAEELAQILHAYESCMEGQPEMFDCGHYMAEHLDLEKLYALYDRALLKASTPRFRNNIRLMRMVLRYTELESKEVNYDHEGFYPVQPDYEDPTGELAKMTEFESFWRNDPGYGIMIPLKSEKTYDGDMTWYDFEE
ncbi:MAG: DUF4838 domain-containing protein [Clostridia bacterium]|nr:DUF4838 domain-containing protein [Clostridia bacterium]